MTSTEEIADSAAAIRDERLREIYVRLANEVATRTAEGFSGAWTFRSLGRLVGLPQSDPMLQACVELLVLQVSPKLLDMHFRLHLPGDDLGIDLDDETVRSAFATSELVLPDGQKIRDFESLMAPYFTPAGSEYGD